MVKGKLKPSARRCRVCANCGRHFAPKVHNQIYCSSFCREEAAGKASRRAVQSVPDAVPDEDYDDLEELGPVLALYNRKCHDCGKPTNDYRCPECRRKWQIKHMVEHTEE